MYNLIELTSCNAGLTTVVKGDRMRLVHFITALSVGYILHNPQPLPPVGQDDVSLFWGQSSNEIL